MIMEAKGRLLQLRSQQFLRYLIINSIVMSSRSSVKQQISAKLGKPKKRKQFVVDANRVQLDEYMLNHIKSNRREVKTLKKEVCNLKNEVKKLKDQHFDYYQLQKARTHDNSRAQSSLRSHKSQRQIQIPVCQVRNRIEPKTTRKSKQNSILSRSSSAKSQRISKSQFYRKKESVNMTRVKLANKIEELKTRARLEEGERRQIKKSVEKKIKKLVGEDYGKGNTGSLQKEQLITKEKYQQLMELLKTNKSIHSLVPSPKKQQPSHVTHFDAFQPQRLNSNSIRVEDEKEKVLSEKTIQSTVNFQAMSSSAISQIGDDKKTKPFPSGLKSQTNLLDSSPSRSEQSPKHSKRPLKLSRCVELNVRNQGVSSGEEGSGMEAIFGRMGEMRSAGLQLSFESFDSSKRRLREMQFEFDQLVRQQLLSVDAREKELIAQTIRTLMCSITELRERVGREGK